MIDNSTNNGAHGHAPVNVVKNTLNCLGWLILKRCVFFVLSNSTTRGIILGMADETRRYNAEPIPRLIAEHTAVDVQCTEMIRIHSLNLVMKK